MNPLTHLPSRQQSADSTSTMQDICGTCRLAEPSIGIQFLLQRGRKEDKTLCAVGVRVRAVQWRMSGLSLHLSVHGRIGWIFGWQKRGSGVGAEA